MALERDGERLVASYVPAYAVFGLAACTLAAVKHGAPTTGLLSREVQLGVEATRTAEPVRSSVLARPRTASVRSASASLPISSRLTSG